MDFQDTASSNKCGLVARVAKAVVGEARQFDGTKKDLGVRGR